MKIEIDLNDILSDEDYGSETLQESIRRQVIATITNVVKTGVNKQLNDEVQKVINEEVKTAVQEKLPVIIEKIFSEEYIPVDRYGSSNGKPTTFRAELVKAVNDQMVYKTAHYSSDKNVFTKAVDEVVAQNVAIFKSDFNKQVDANFTAEVMTAAQKKLQERLGLKAA